jgi:hypothetical protein
VDHASLIRTTLNEYLHRYYVYYSLGLGGEYMPNQQNNQQKGKTNSNQQGSGSQYHKEHASNVPDYGANTVDPNAFTNSTENNE